MRFNNFLRKKFKIMGYLLLIIVTLSLAQSNHAAQAIDIQVYTADSKPYGLSYAEWSAKWWQWALSIPNKDNPVEDKTGINCNKNQEGPVWFLAGTGGGSVIRNCEIPAGKSILFPIINVIIDFATNPSFKTESDLKNNMMDFKSAVKEVSVDGIKIDPTDYQFMSPLFNFTLPPDNTYDLPAGTTTQAVSNGYWIMLKPLPIGSHEIHFKGIVFDYTATGVVNFNTESNYKINIVK